eukprot:CAMPEP_0174760302 /NCGR_PEP_ID=MMETSP1094-20130205/108702_1 /TAXON_ID=156173 /ORGANISM="Chrysochromulina brevifilum, Strain UTEX LB 985" /LENGTH=80 /DNA_ID=CAMNT_0015966243 /DNA_START=307 /DNA_END=549 /DNA_ORIENTATION=-
MAAPAPIAGRRIGGGRVSCPTDKRMPEARHLLQCRRHMSLEQFIVGHYWVVSHNLKPSVEGGELLCRKHSECLDAETLKE